MHSRADLHVHSKYSNRPSEWILRRLGSPESFVEPVELYHTVRRRGMQFVTISDHNCIDGAMEIAHLPGTFISNEVTTYFPEDRCKVHFLVIGITPQQFEVIQEVRESIYDLRDYVLHEDIIHSVAHPLFRVNDRLTVEQFEKLIVLFNCFEGINGSRDPRACELANVVLRNITRSDIERLAEKHRIDPIGPEPWKKHFTGGSDDHSSVYSAGAYTITPHVETVAAYLDHLRAGRHEMGGRGGTSLRLAHSFYHIAHSFYQDRFLSGDDSKQTILGELFKKMLEEPRQPPKSVGRRMKDAVYRGFRRRKIRTYSPMEQTLIHEFSGLFARRSADNGDGAIQTDDRSFEIACNISQQLGYSFFEKFIQHLRAGDMVESLQTFASLAPVGLSIAPYLAAFSTQHKDETFLRDLAGAFESSRHLAARSQKRAWVTDTFTDVNGVSRTIRTMAECAQRRHKQLTVVTCLDEAPTWGISLQNFQPVGTFRLPEYEQQMLAFPPFLEVMEWLEREQFSEIIISTPGPLGMNALAAGRLLRIPATGIYHTDFPQYVRHFTDNALLEEMTWGFMRWFYNQMSTIYVPSRAYLDLLANQGFDPEKLKVMPRGIDLNRFHPDHDDADFLGRFGAGDRFTFIYVGRVSREKNVEALLATFVEFRKREHDAQLVIVGDGPQFAELQDKYRRDDIIFTGFLDGDDVARAYTACDCFVFPSTTDTFGNVVLEAQACGVPVIVSDRGGPREIVESTDSGIVVDLDHPGELLEAMVRIYADDNLRALMRQRGIENAANSGWDEAFAAFWEGVDREEASSVGEYATAASSTSPPMPSIA